MVMVERLPDPSLGARRFGARCVPALTDERLFQSTGVRIAFTGRVGGVSVGPYSSLNLASHVNDNPCDVKKNRRELLRALGVSGTHLIVPNQVHGNTVLTCHGSDEATFDALCAQAAAGVDALVVTCCNLSALLCFADCVSLIVVSPTGNFAVVHAGWRGVLNGVAACAVQELLRCDKALWDRCTPSAYNVYVGPHIHAECFEASLDVRASFAKRFKNACIVDDCHVSLLAALIIELEEVGINQKRILDSGICTSCSSDTYFSYRASGGVCGRHGAIAYRKP